MNNPTDELIRQLDSVRRSNDEQLELYNRVVAQRDMLYEALKLYVSLCGNTAYIVDTDGLQLAFSKAINALTKVEAEREN